MPMSPQVLRLMRAFDGLDISFTERNKTQKSGLIPKPADWLSWSGGFVQRLCSQKVASGVGSERQSTFRLASWPYRSAGTSRMREFACYAGCPFGNGRGRRTTPRTKRPRGFTSTVMSTFGEDALR
jgi:hypothetical protein